MDQKLFDRAQELLMSVLIMTLENADYVELGNSITKHCNTVISRLKINDMETAIRALEEAETLHAQMLQEIDSQPD